MLESNPDELLVSVLQTEFENVPHERTQQSVNGEQPRLHALAAALAASPLWKETPRAVLVVRPEPEPLLGVVGYFDAAGRKRLEGLRRQLDRVLPRTHYVGYKQAEEDCERLAEKLVERFGREELLQSFRFTAIPRGGYIVLGMLAYVLGLRRSQLEPPHPPENPLMVVDDCALSGVRFGEFLERLENRQVVFAHLYSPPQLRQAIEYREHREVTCLSARDLKDYAPTLQGNGYASWRERWLDRMDGRGYWVGQHDHVCFAWNEPDISIWNPVTEQEESGWYLVPPDLCLKNRPAHGEEPIAVQVQPEGNGPLKPSVRVLFGEIGEQLVIGDLKTEESFVLEGVGADMWRAVIRHGDLETALTALLKEYEVDRPTLRADLNSFVKGLRRRGWLVDDV